MTGGWVAGVLFEAWRSDEHVAEPGRRGRRAPRLSLLADPRSAHPARARVPDHHLGARRRHGAACGGARRGAARLERLASLRAKHLPVAWRRTAGSMRCHARVREYLLALWSGEAAEVRGVRATHAELLLARDARGGRRGDPAGAAAGARDRARSARIETRDRPARLRDGRAVAGDARGRGAAGAGGMAVAEMMLALGREDYRAAGAWPIACTWCPSASGSPANPPRSGA